MLSVLLNKDQFSVVGMTYYGPARCRWHYVMRTSLVSSALSHKDQLSVINIMSLEAVYCQRYFVIKTTLVSVGCVCNRPVTLQASALRVADLLSDVLSFDTRGLMGTTYLSSRKCYLIQISCVSTGPLMSEPPAVCLTYRLHYKGQLHEQQTRYAIKISRELNR